MSRVNNHDAYAVVTADGQFIERTAHYERALELARGLGAAKIAHAGDLSEGGCCTECSRGGKVVAIIRGVVMI